MLTRMERQHFDSLDDESLIWECIEPVIRQIRGKSVAIKREAASHLTSGQQALLMFQVLYGHSCRGGITELFSSLSYLLDSKGIWQELKDAMDYFHIAPMVTLLNDMQSAYFSQENNNSSSNDRQEPWNAAVIQKLDAELNIALPVALKSVAAAILNNPNEFVEFIS
jgi:hypothetical protein